MVEIISDGNGAGCGLSAFRKLGTEAALGSHVSRSSERVAAGESNFVLCR